MARSLWMPTSLLSGVLLCACATMGRMELDKSVVYAPDIMISEGNLETQGTVVLQNLPSHKLHLERHDGKFDALQIQSCSGRIFSEVKDNEYDFTYTPNEIEKSRPCELTIYGIEKDKGRDTWGVIDFESDRDTVRASVLCNRAPIVMNGTGICASPINSVVKLSFQVPVNMLSLDPACTLDEKTLTSSDDKKTWEITTPRTDGCVFVIKEKGAEHYGRLRLIGFEQNVIRRSR